MHSPGKGHASSGTTRKHAHGHMSSNGSAASMQTTADPNELLVVADQHPANLFLGPEELVVTGTHRPSITSAAASFVLKRGSRTSSKRIPYDIILDVKLERQPSLDDLLLTVHCLKTSTDAELRTLKYEVPVHHELVAQEWIERLLAHAYPATRRHRRFKVFVNPASGPGKAKAIWQTKCQPIFEAAGCHLDVSFTEGRDHAKQACQTLDLEKYDGIAIVSGDGLVHEILNGLALRTDARKALMTPLAALPAGSANAFGVNVSSPARGRNPAYQCLVAIKGRPMSIDLASVTQGSQRYFSFLSQAFGLMADVDLGTEDNRWMGDTRFVLGFVQGVLSERTYNCTLSMRIVGQGTTKESKGALVDDHKKRATDTIAQEGSLNSKDYSLPRLRFGTVQDPLPEQEAIPVSIDKPLDVAPGLSKWTTFRGPVSTVYAGLQPYVAKDYMPFPLACGDGLIDISIALPLSRYEGLSGLDGAGEGNTLHHSNVQYYRVEAYRLTPEGRATKGKVAKVHNEKSEEVKSNEVSPVLAKEYISIDGESVPYEPFQVEAHRGLGRTFTLDPSGSLYKPDQWK
ncbi:uncharacterized protein L969DRAFT_54632 [Mixia osmundae IAM 14324]|uniref:DAGKc domain-containing protein n=1 Tax=Mixia osmundae (strain CBS 9802 / IAM 14324 / JCM 22182 / KY 12970) TaxID=764103 RepID=G7E1V2_MIXOS|nr:uncharacterized protein L969DRAFT_54632 [Mixia osmundae IAM 14324]KEI36758.1 hypothetical protein L969DRAFT_54632 [Mixia osmundae IAM 14324]GAA96812.1 hypothetical protein E5Q_03484 [Mixia osmundae IAM 14324]